MIEVKMNLPGGELHTGTIENQELIKGILAMPDEEFGEIIRGIIDPIKLDANKFMIVFAYCGNRLKKIELDPAQLNVLEGYIKDFKICQD